MNTNTIRRARQELLQQVFHRHPQPLRWHQRHFNILHHTSTPKHRPQILQQRFLHVPTRTTFNRLWRFPRSQAWRRRFASATAEQNLSLSQRLRKLSREYGWSALGVYLLLSVADFPFCFLAVRTLGTDRIGHWEHVIVSKIKEFVSWPFDQPTQEIIDGAVQEVQSTIQKKLPVEEVRQDGLGKRVLEEEETYVIADHGYDVAERANRGSNASLWTQLALAYAIHKSFIFIRVPLTAAVTPKVVKTLRSWGWNIGKKPSTVATSRTGPGVNTKGSGVKSD